MITSHYCSILDNYIKWDCGDGIGGLTVKYDPYGPDPEDVMFEFESKGKMIESCADPGRLERYWRGKKWRDWHLTEWKKGIDEGTLIPCEIKNALGITKKDYKNLIGVY